MGFGERLKKLRLKKGLKMRELERLTGISQAYISQMESGKRSIPAVDVIKKLADGFCVSSIDLMVMAGYFSKEDIEVYNRGRCECNE